MLYPKPLGPQIDSLSRSSSHSVGLVWLPAPPRTLPSCPGLFRWTRPTSQQVRAGAGVSATRSTQWGAGSRARDLPSTFRERFDGGPTVTAAEISQRVQAKPVSRLEKHGTQRAAGRAGLTGRAEGVGGPSTQRWARRPWESPGHWAYATPLSFQSLPGHRLCAWVLEPHRQKLPVILPTALCHKHHQALTLSRSHQSKGMSHCWRVGRRPAW